MVEFEQRNDTISLIFEKNPAGCCMESRLYWGKTISRETSKEAITITQVRYDGGLVVAVEF